MRPDVLWGIIITTLSMIHAVLPAPFLLPGINNVTIIQDDLTTEAFFVDSVNYRHRE